MDERDKGAREDRGGHVNVELLQYRVDELADRTLPEIEERLRTVEEWQTNYEIAAAKGSRRGGFWGAVTGAFAACVAIAIPLITFYFTVLRHSP